VAHPNGLVEVSEGPLVGTSLELTSTTVVGTRSAKEVTAVSRRIRVAQDRLEYGLDMAAVGVSLCGHLRAVLRRVAAAPS
jgi:hypothetical protein